MFEGIPQYPTWARIGHVIDKHNITILYTAPTAIRAMMREGDAYVRESDRSSLRLLGSVGEPINPEAWNWYHEVVVKAVVQLSIHGGKLKQVAF
jgi:acetyl-CoA synthetase